MTIHDRVYGDIEIKEKFLIDLINTNLFQRLKGVSQDGSSHLIQHSRNITRFDHSIGVWYLSYLYKRPIEEQVACLLNDISHTAFSHVIDFVLKDYKEEYADGNLNEMIMNSEYYGLSKVRFVDPFIKKQGN